MKRGAIFLFLIIVSTASVFAECNLDVTLLNQDPYPAVPGDYVKLVFQVDEIDSEDCGDITFTLLEDYPLEFDPDETGSRTYTKVEYIKDYESSLLIPYEVRVDEDALDGTSSIEVNVQNKNGALLSKTFDIEIEDARADFEIYVSDYDYSNNELTLEILNIEASDIEALTIEIPKQDSITIKGSSRIVVGDLDSNEYTTADFEAIPTDGEFQVNLIYSDSINVRRTVSKTVTFDSSYFVGRISDQEESNPWFYVVLAIIAIFLVRIVIKKIKKKCKKKN